MDDVMWIVEVYCKETGMLSAVCTVMGYHAAHRKADAMHCEAGYEYEVYVTCAVPEVM